MDLNKIIEIGKNSFDSEIKALIDSKNILDRNFANAAIKISKSSKIIVTGVGKSGAIAKKIAATFSSIGVPAHFLHPVDALHGDIGIVESADVVIMLSKSGASEELVKLIPYIKARNAFIISLVSNDTSYLANNSDICLFMPIESEACPLNIVPTSSSTVALAMGDALAVATMHIKNVSIEDFSMQHPLGQIGRNIILKVADVMHKDNKIPKIFAGESFKKALIVMSEKKLGCICIVNQKDVLQGIITDGDVRRTLQKYDNIGNLTADEVMNSNPQSVREDVLLGEALSLMSSRESQISVLPVINSVGKVIGIIRVHDIIRSSM
jgi:arabinose-5-phosphate isomerase